MFAGDFTVEDTLDVKFTTRRFTTGAPFALASGVISAYPNNSTTQITAGITLSADFDTVTGLNNIRVVATAANGYAAGSSYDLVITTGTVDSVSVVGEVVGRFTLGRSAAFTRLGAPAGASIAADLVTLDNFIDTEIAAIISTLGTPAGASISADLLTIDNLVDDLESRVGTPSNLGGGATLSFNLSDIEAQTDDIGVAGAGLTVLATQASVNTIDDFLDTEVAAILSAVDTEVAATLALLNDARTEPGVGAPTVNPNLATKIDYLYKAWRNKKTNDGTTTTLFADDTTTAHQTQATSEAAGTVTKGEWA